MADNELLAPDAQADVSVEIRDRYVAYRRAQAELRAWIEFGGEQQSGTETKLRSHETSALDALVKSPAESVADVAIKLQVLKDLSESNPAAMSGALQRLSQEASLLSQPIGRLEGQITALRIGLMLLLNAAAGNPQGLERARRAILDLLESPTGALAGAKVNESAKQEVSSLFTWID